MRMRDRIPAACGNDCAACPRYTEAPYEKTEAELARTAELWHRIGYRKSVVPVNEIACRGCREDTPCRYGIRKCATEHNAENCGRCGLYPCARTEECFRVTASFLPACRENCNAEELALLRRAFFEKEQNLNGVKERKSMEEDILGILTDKDDARAYAKVKEIAAASARSDEYLPYLETFASLLQAEKSFVRTRAFLLCCHQARWADAERMRKILPGMLVLFHDPRPTVVRQCLRAIREVAAASPSLCPAVKEELLKMDLSGYKDSVAPLIRKDIDAVLALLDKEA